MVVGQQCQQQVEYCYVVVGGYVVVILFEQVIGGDDFGEVFGEVIVLMLVYCGVIVVEQVELGQWVDVGGQCVDCCF